MPLFWEQNSVGINPVPRFVGSPEGNQKAFAAHCKMLIREYGYVHCLDLLSSSKQGEAKLSEAYRLAVKDQTLGHSLLKQAETADPSWQYTPWDFHAHVQVLGFEDALRTLNTKPEIVDTLNRIKYFHSVGPKVKRRIFLQIRSATKRRIPHKLSRLSRSNQCRSMVSLPTPDH